MLKHFLEVRMFDENGNTMLTASAPGERLNSGDLSDHQAFVDFRSMLHLLRTMKEQKDHRGSQWWRFELDPDSARAKLIANALRII